MPFGGGYQRGQREGDQKGSKREGERCVLPLTFEQKKGKRGGEGWGEERKGWG